MTKKTFLKKYRVIIILSLIVVVMGTIKWKYRNTTWKEAIKITPTPTENKDRGYPLWRLLPYSGDGFIIDRYTAPGTLTVKIIKGTKEETEKKVGEWLKTQGGLGENHKLEWNQDL